MVEISIHGDRVHFEVQGWDKFWALKSRLEFPLSHIRSVRRDPEPACGWWGAGTGIDEVEGGRRKSG